ncbi:MAG: hypothetical protein ACRBBP_03730 [Bdellovibrionales bacterium]
MNLINNGLGPAKIEKFEIKHKGSSYKNIGKVLIKLFPAFKDTTYSTDKGAVKVLLPGKSMNLVSTDLSPKQRATLYKAGLELSICYCSLYNTCWKLEDSNDSTPVKSCEDL